MVALHEREELVVDGLVLDRVHQVVRARAQRRFRDDELGRVHRERHARGVRLLGRGAHDRFLPLEIVVGMTSGTATPVACTPTAMSTALPPFTRTPGPGLELTTLPTCVVSLVCWLVCLPRMRPWLLSSAVASATLIPRERGHVHERGPGAGR